jgi:hypothetical protein
VLLLAACTSGNPLYKPDYVYSTDAATPIGVTTTDMAMSGSVDLSPPANQCTDGQRSCGPAAKASEDCMSGAFVPDRACPQASMCADGYCAAPPASGSTNTGKSCETGNTVSDTSCKSGSGPSGTCQPFITAAGPPATVTWVCDTPVGAGVAGTACTENQACGSGFCGSNGTCFVACFTDLECPDPMHMQCVSETIVVEGSPVVANSCIPM